MKIGTSWRYYTYSLPPQNFAFKQISWEISKPRGERNGPAKVATAFEMILWVFEKLFSLIDEKDLPENAFALRHSQVIDFMKGITPVIILGLIAAFNQWENPTAWVYLGTHGTYGILWVWKSTFGFGDKRWTGKKSWFTNFATLFGLFLYWVPIWIIASTPVNAPPFILGISVVLFGLGVFFHFASDMHKTVFLEFREKIKKLDDKVSLIADLVF